MYYGPAVSSKFHYGWNLSKWDEVGEKAETLMDWDDLRISNDNA